MNKLILLKAIFGIALISQITIASEINKENIKTQLPNIVFILADDLGSRTLSADGNPLFETPNIDQLAKDGMRFTQGYASAATCKPSRYSIMSGQYSPRTGGYRVAERTKGKEDLIKYKIIPNAPMLALDRFTIAEGLKTQGYTTASFGKWHMAKGNKVGLPDVQGFDTHLTSQSVHFDAKTVPATKLPKGSFIGDVMTDRAIQFMEQANKKQQPFFVYLPYYLIHKPWTPKAEDLAHFNKKMPKKEYGKDLPKIAALTKALDNSVGQVLASLKAMGIEDNTLVIFTSDNGGYKVGKASNKNFKHLNYLNGDLRGYKGEVYEGGIRVPYFFKWPGKIAKGSTSDERIAGIDLLPTILDFGHSQTPKGYPIDGVSFADIILDKKVSHPERDLFWFFPKYAGFDKRKKLWRDEWRNVIISGDYKLIEFVETARVELFDLNKDIYEQHDLSQSKPELVKKLMRKLTAWKKSIDAPKPEKNPNYSL